MVVTGEAGVGKSRFLLHIAADCRSRLHRHPAPRQSPLAIDPPCARRRAVVEAALALSDEELQFIRATCRMVRGTQARSA